MTIKLAEVLAGISLESILFLVLIRRRAFSSLPVFTIYIAASICTDSVACMIHAIFPHYYASICIVNVFLDFAFILGVVVELGRNVLRFNRVNAPNWLLALVLFVMASLMLQMLSHWPVEPHLSFVWQIILHAVQAAVILEFAAFLALIWWTGLRHLRWPRRELRIVTGFGFYSLIALGAAIVHTHQSIDQIYRRVDMLVIASYLGVLIYWLSCFTFEDAGAVENRGFLRGTFAATGQDWRAKSRDFATARPGRGAESGAS